MTTITEEVHDLDAPGNSRSLPQRLPWVVAAIASVLAALALIPRPAIAPAPASTQAPASTNTDTPQHWIGGKDFVCRTVADGSVTIEDAGGDGFEPYGHVVTGTGLAVCVWVLPG